MRPGAPTSVRLTHPQQLHPLRFLLTHRQIFQEVVTGPETLVQTRVVDFKILFGCWYSWNAKEI